MTGDPPTEYRNNKKLDGPKASHKQYRSQHYVRNIHTWLIVRHFLPASYIIDFCRGLVHIISHGKFEFHDIFQSQILGNGLSLSSFYIQPKNVEGRLELAAQRVIRSIVWQGDAEIWLFDADKEIEEYSTLEAIDSAYKLGSADLNFLSKNKDDLPEILIHYLDGIPVADKASGADVKADGFLGGVPYPLNALLAKHVGDLHADVDAWFKALIYYDHALKLLNDAEFDEWHDLANILRTIISQSRAAAFWFMAGPESASTEYRKLLSENSTEFDEVLKGNAATDAQHARFESGEFWGADLRPSFLAAPLLIDELNLSNAMTSSSSRRFHDAHRWFWATLRRQTALGGFVHMHRTKSLYAVSLLQDLSLRIERDYEAETLGLAVRMFVESCDEKAVATADWSEAFVQTYINSKIIEDVISFTRSAEGVWQKRTRVALELFRVWLTALPADRATEAETMLSFIASSCLEAQKHPTRFHDNDRAALKIITEIAKARPEFCALIRDQLSNCFLESMENPNMLVLSEAISASSAYLRYLDFENIRDIVSSIQRIISNGRAGQGNWVVKNAIVDLLSSETILHLAKDYKEIGRDAASGLIAISLSAGSENDTIMYTLRNLDPALIPVRPNEDQLKTIVDELKVQAAQINSSAASGKIHALLVAPAISGTDGIREAIANLQAIILSAVNGRPAISFSGAYRPLLLLAETKDDILNVLTQSDLDPATLIHPLTEALARMWRVAASDPLIFRGFSIPERTAPDLTIAHNWTFASDAFARNFGVMDEIDAALNTAKQNPLLFETIATARALRIDVNSLPSFQAENIKTEPKGAFYTSLGQRISFLSSFPATGQVEIVQSLLDRCLEVGPNGLDSSLFFAADTLGLKLDRESPKVIAYQQKLLNDKQLRLTLFHFLIKVMN